MKLKTIICTCSCCPAQWEAYTEENEAVYIRYRFGHLTIQIGEPGGTISDAINRGTLLYSEQIGLEFDGVISEEEVMKIIEKEKL
jgi:hypothetical protein